VPLYVHWTKQQFIDAARRELLDPNSKYWSDSELGGYVDQWQDRVQDQYELIWGTSTATVTTSTSTATLPSDMLRLDAVYWNNRRLAQRTSEELDIRLREWRNSNANLPVVVYQELGADTVSFWPTPSATGTVVYEYPKILSFGTTTSTTSLPAWAAISANNYILFRSHLRHGPNQDINKAMRYKAAFLRDLASVSSFKAGYMAPKYLSLRPSRQYERDILEPSSPLGDPTMPTLTVTVSFADEVPSGTIDGVNLTFTLTHSPDPVASLELHKNGLLMIRNTHYTLSGSTITFTSPYQPITGDDLFASYRYTA
jgi:hypothetical protein